MLKFVIGALLILSCVRFAFGDLLLVWAGFATSSWFRRKFRCMN